MSKPHGTLRLTPFLTLLLGGLLQTSTALAAPVDKGVTDPCQDDTQPPVFLDCPPPQITFSADPGVCGATVTFPEPTTDDNCPGVTVTQTQGLTSGSLFPVGGTTVEFQATDGNGNTATCSFVVIVNDNEPPTFTECPPPVITPTTDPGQCGAIVSFNVSATDNCPGLNLTLDQGLPSGSFFPLGLTQVRYIALDASGNGVSCEFDVFVQDGESPVLTIPADVTLECGDPFDPSATGEATALDACDGPLPTGFSDAFNPNPSCNTKGANKVVGGAVIILREWTAIDAAGNPVSETQTITINDTQPPNLTIPPDTTVECGDDYSPASTGEATAMDDCDYIVFPTHFDQRIAKSQDKSLPNPLPGEIVERIWTATDFCGNSVSLSQIINFVDTIPPVIVGCPANITVSVDPGQCGAVVTFTPPTATDTCFPPTVAQTAGPASGSLFPIGATTVEYTATDLGGNSTPCSFTVTVLGSSAIVEGVAFDDANRNGLQDDALPGLDGIAVDLIEISGVVVDSTVTAGGGFYLFTSVPAGDYFVSVPSVAPRVYSPLDVGVDDTIDSDIEPLTGWSAPFTISTLCETIDIDVGALVPGSGTIITGPDSGAPPNVREFATNTGGGADQIFAFDAYSPTFTGGVRVASGDVNGDGTPDIITGAGPGGGPHVRVFDGTNHSLLGDFFAYSPSFTGGIFVASGDVNNDGFDDIITGPDAGAGPHVKVFDGANSAHPELASFFAFAPSFTGGVRVASGDVNGDGFDDIITGPGPGGGPQVRVLESPGLSTDLHNFFAYDPAFTGGVHVGAGDVTGDGRADIITGPGAGGGPHVKVFDGLTGAEVRSFFSYPPGFAGGVRVAVGDVDGDGLGEMLTAPGPGGVGAKFLASGSDIKVFDGFTSAQTHEFYPYPGFLGGLFVGGPAPEPLGDTHVLVNGTTLCLFDVSGDSDDDIILSIDTAGNLVVHDPNNTLTAFPPATQDGPNTVLIPLTSITDIKVETFGGDDSLTLVPVTSVQWPFTLYNGGDNGSGGDVLRITSPDSFFDITYNHTNASDGTIDLGSGPVITYTGLEPITATITAVNITLNFSGVNETITVSDPGPGQTSVDSTAGEIVTFINPTGSLTINSGDGDDQIDVTGFGAGFDADLFIDGQGDADTIDVQTDPATTSLLFLQAESIEINSALVSTGQQNYIGTVSLPSIPSTLAAPEVLLFDDLNLSGFDLTLVLSGFSSFIGNGISGNGNVIHIGSELQIGEAGTQTGTIETLAGLLLLFGSTGPDGQVLASGGTVGGFGVVGNSLTANSGAIAPGFSPGILTSGDLLMNAASIYDVEIEGSFPGAHDQLVVNGSVTLNDPVLSLSGLHVPTPADSFVIISNDGVVDPVAGTFTGLPEGSVINFNGVDLVLTYAGGDGNDVVLAPIPPIVSLMYGSRSRSGNPATSGALVVIDEATADAEVVGPAVNPTAMPGLTFASDGRLYAIENVGPGGSTTSNLVELDPITGTVISTIATYGISIGDLATQPGTDVIYGIRSNADGTLSGGELYTIDSVTGALTFVGDTTSPAGGGIAFHPDGTLYFTTSSPNLRVLNPATAAVISSIPLSRFFDGLGVSAAGVLYGTPGGSGGGLNLYTIDPVTGAETFIGTNPVGPLSDVAFNPAGGSVGDLVFHDLDADGRYEASQGETPIAGVRVELFDAINGAPTGLTDVSDANGAWLITGVPPGDYFLVHTDDVPGTLLGFEWTRYVSPVANRNLWSDVLEELQPVPAVPGTTLPFTLAPNEVRLDFAAGMYRRSSLDGRVWLDKQAVVSGTEGIRDPGEPDLGGIPVLLVIQGQPSSTWQTTATAGDGTYSFSNVIPGTSQFSVQFALPGVPLASFFSPPNIGGDDTVDSDVAISGGAQPGYDGRTVALTLLSDQSLSNVDAGMIDRTLPAPTLVCGVPDNECVPFPTVVHEVFFDESVVVADPGAFTVSNGFISGFLAAPPAQLITNGGFETGAHGPEWAIIGLGAATGPAINDGTIPISAVPPGGGTSPPIGGAFDSYTNQFSPAFQSVCQTVVIPPQVPQATLSWSDRIYNSAGVFFEAPLQIQDPNGQPPAQEARVVIRDLADNFLAEIWSTDPGDPANQAGPNNRSFDVTSILQGLAGQSVKVCFEQIDNQSNFSQIVDNVSLTIAQPFLIQVTAASEGPVTLTIGPGAFQDSAMNPSPGPVSCTFIYDATAPLEECGGELAGLSGSLTTETTLFASVTFTEDVYNVDPLDFLLGPAGTVDSVTPVSGPAISYLIEYSVPGPGIYTLTFNQPSPDWIEDCAGNDFPGSNSIVIVEVVPVPGVPDGNALQDTFGASSGDHFGWDVDVDDVTALVGVPDDDDVTSGLQSTGSVAVYEWDGVSSWILKQVLIPSVLEQGQQFGRGVSIAGDWAAVGASREDANGIVNSGAVYVFRRDSGSGLWAETQRLTPPSGPNFMAGDEVALWGSTLVVAIPQATTSNGSFRGGRLAVYEYDACIDTWSLAAEIEAPDASGYDAFATSVDVFGNIIAAGAPGDDDNGSRTGAAYFFRRTGAGLWVPDGKVVPATAATGDNFGHGVALGSSAGGLLAVCGAPSDDDAGLNTGAVYRLRRVGPGNWVQLGGTIVAGDPQTGSQFGKAVDTDGTTIAVGAPNDPTAARDAGSLYAFRAATAAQIAKYLPPQADRSDNTGHSVAVSGVTILGGAPNANLVAPTGVFSEPPVGAAYIYRLP